MLEMRVWRFNHNHLLFKKKNCSAGDEGSEVHPQPLFSREKKLTCFSRKKGSPAGDEGSGVHPQPSQLGIVSAIGKAAEVIVRRPR